MMVARPKRGLPSRRDVIFGLGAAASAAALGGRAAFADTPTDLIVSTRTIEVRNRAATVLGVAQSDGRLGLDLNLSQRFRVKLHNRLDRPTLIHWHGFTPPTAQDGVPGLSQPALAPGQTYDYDFALSRSGTFWMHSHFGLQEQSLLAAPLIVHDPVDRGRDEQTVVILLHDFSFRSPEEIFSGLIKGVIAGTNPVDGMPMRAQGHAAATGEMKSADRGDRKHSGGMDMDMDMGAAADINDVDFDAYLANDRTLADPEIVRVERGGQIRLRIINGSAGTNFHISLGRMVGELIAVDGDPIIPLKRTEFPLAIAQRIDIRLQLPRGKGAYPILARREGAREQTGIVLATAGATIVRLLTLRRQPTRAIGFALESRLQAAQPLPARKPDRTLRVDLGGDMMGYVWTINGKIYEQRAPLTVKQGERVEFVLRNQTMMSHPMHLHGHHFQVVGFDGKPFSGAMRDTVLVPPRKTVNMIFDADNPGRWAFHCHNLYHMAAGMMTEIRYG